MIAPDSKGSHFLHKWNLPERMKRDAGSFILLNEENEHRRLALFKRQRTHVTRQPPAAIGRPFEGGVGESLTFLMISGLIGPVSIRRTGSRKSTSSVNFSAVVQLLRY